MGQSPTSVRPGRSTSFGGGNDGAVPSAALIAVKGTLYGTTSGGGTYGKGTVFALRP